MHRVLRGYSALSTRTGCRRVVRGVANLALAHGWRGVCACRELRDGCRRRDGTERRQGSGSVGTGNGPKRCATDAEECAPRPQRLCCALRPLFPLPRIQPRLHRAGRRQSSHPPLRPPPLRTPTHLLTPLARARSPPPRRSPPPTTIAAPLSTKHLTIYASGFLCTVLHPERCGCGGGTRVMRCSGGYLVAPDVARSCAHACMHASAGEARRRRRWFFSSRSRAFVVDAG